MAKSIENKKPILIALIQWILSTVLQIDRLFFTYYRLSKYMLATKALYLIFLLIVWCFIFEARNKIQNGEFVWKRGFFVFKVYFSVMMLLLLVLWPGTWSWDDLWTLSAISYYGGWNAWQHVLTGIYQDVLLQILPFPGGIILLQNLIISLCVAFVVTKLENIFTIGRLKNTALDIIVKILPFLTPPVLMYQFSGYRMGLYVYIELVMLVMLICSWKDKKEWDLYYLLLFSILCVIVATWRTESFFYIPCACLLVLFIKKSIIPNRRKVLCIAILLIGFLGMNKFQNLALGDSNYEIISLLRPCAELVRTADYEGDAEELSIIDKVTDLEVIRNNPTFNGEALYWNTGCVRNRNDNPDDDYTDEDYRNFLKAFVKLSLKYPKVVIAERWNLFLVGSGITGESVWNVPNAAALFDENNANSAAEVTLTRGWIANSPVFKKMRTTLINVLGIRNNEGKKIEWLSRIIWNAVIPEIILLYAWFKMLIRKEWFWTGICTAVLIRLPVVVLTQPAGWIMYVLSFYFLGYVFLIYAILIHLSEQKMVEKINSGDPGGRHKKDHTIRGCGQVWQCH